MCFQLCVTTTLPTEDQHDYANTSAALFFLPSETSGLWNDGTGEDGIAAPLDEVHYTYTVLNNGTVTLTNLTITDIVIVDTVCSEQSLPPGESFTCEDNIYLVSTSGQQATIICNRTKIEPAIFGKTLVLRCAALF